VIFSQTKGQQPRTQHDDQVCNSLLSAPGNKLSYSFR